MLGFDSWTGFATVRGGEARCFGYCGAGPLDFSIGACFTGLVFLSFESALIGAKLEFGGFGHFVGSTSFAHQRYFSARIENLAETLRLEISVTMCLIL